MRSEEYFALINANLSTMGSNPAAKSLETKTKFPLLLLIFSPSKPTIPVWTKEAANLFPVIAKPSAALMKWCGNIKSLPPPCRSIIGSGRSLALR